MTPRKIHYWLDEGLLDEPIRFGQRGVPTLLSFNQVLRIKVLQRLRDELGLSLRRSWEVLHWTLATTFGEQSRHIYVTPLEDGVALSDGVDIFKVPTGQGILPGTLAELEHFLEDTRSTMESRVLRIPGYSWLVSDPSIMGGAPVIQGTRIETSFLSHLSQELPVPRLALLYPKVDVEAIEEALSFERKAAA